MQGFEQTLLLQICSDTTSARRGVVLLGEPETGPFALVATWPDASGPSDLLAHGAERALAERNPVDLEGDTTGVAACPILVDERLYGLIALEYERGAEPERLVLQRLRWAAMVLAAQLRAEQSSTDLAASERLMSTLDMIATALAEPSYRISAQGLTTDLAIRLDCERVSIGFVKNQDIAVAAISHGGTFGERMNLVQAISAAMNEAVDQQALLGYPPVDSQRRVLLNHQRLSEVGGGSEILTIPFHLDEHSAGAFVFERRAGFSFDEQAIGLCQSVTALGSRILDVKRLNDRALLTRLRDGLQAEFAKWIGPRHVWRKIILLGVALMTLFLVVAEGEYKISADSTVFGEVRRVLVAPFDGYIATSSLRAGDAIRQGDVLAALDDRELQLQYYKFTSQRSQYLSQYERAAAGHERALTSIILSQVKQAEAEITLLKEQIDRTQIVAPFDGIIVSGDLSQSLGASVKRGDVLFEITPLDKYRVILDVGEEDITDIAEGQRGKLVLASLPGDPLDLVISKVTPVTQAHDGRSYFRVEALLENESPRLRPGMQGVARVEAGQRKIAWIWFHRAFDWLRVKLWSWT